MKRPYATRGGSVGAMRRSMGMTPMLHRYAIGHITHRPDLLTKRNRNAVSYPMVHFDALFEYKLASIASWL